MVPVVELEYVDVGEVVADPGDVEVPQEIETLRAVMHAVGGDMHQHGCEREVIGDPAEREVDLGVEAAGAGRSRR